jgi:monothiol glutaredoxin
MQDYTKKIEEIINGNRVALFMKGTKDFPMCGFSALVCQILNKLNTDFIDINILEDENMRSAIKTYASWPTIPQLYINGKFIGGSDIVKTLYEEGELQNLLNV